MADPNHMTDALLPLVQTEGQFEAEAIVAILTDAGIDAVAVGPSALDSAVKIGRPGPLSEVRVRASQLADARATLAEVRADAAELDWDTVDLGEPEGLMRGPTILPRVLMWIGFGVAVALLLLTLLVAILMVFA